MYRKHLSGQLCKTIYILIQPNKKFYKQEVLKKFNKLKQMNNNGILNISKHLTVIFSTSQLIQKIVYR